MLKAVLLALGLALLAAPAWAQEATQRLIEATREELNRLGGLLRRLWKPTAGPWRSCAGLVRTPAGSDTEGWDRARQRHRTLGTRSWGLILGLAGSVWILLN